MTDQPRRVLREQGKFSTPKPRRLDHREPAPKVRTVAGPTAQAQREERRDDA